MEDFIKKIKTILTEDEIFLREPMSRHTTFGVGGPADVFLIPAASKLPEVLAELKRHTTMLTIIGNGSNLLVGDGGIEGVVLAVGKNVGNVSCEGNVITAGAGTMLSRAAVLAWQNGLAGMEFAAGIPGSVGGAVVMNAGAYGGEMKDIITKVKVITPDGEELILSKEDMDFCYRNSCVTSKGYLVTETAFTLEKGDPHAIKARMDELKDMRVSKQPLEYPSAGSTFKRPEGYFAGKLIMDAGLKGFTVGGAQVSEKHCGFIINKGGATAEDIRKLIAYVQDTVEARFHVRLETEVKMLGRF